MEGLLLRRADRLARRPIRVGLKRNAGEEFPPCHERRRAGLGLHAASRDLEAGPAKPHAHGPNHQTPERQRGRQDQTNRLGAVGRLEKERGQGHGILYEPVALLNGALALGPSRKLCGVRTPAHDFF